MTPELLLHNVHEIIVGRTKSVSDCHYTTLRLITNDGEVTVTVFHADPRLPIIHGDAT